MDKQYKTTIINRAKLKKYALKVAQEINPQINRVSPYFIDEMEEELEVLIQERIAFHKGKSKTLKPSYKIDYKTGQRIYD